jgi:GT2 family glycosyltransferase
MKISVVIPTINSIEDIKECVSSLKKQSIDCTIIVVANGTTDGTQRYLATDHEDVVVLSHLKALGFAGAVNAGIRYSVDNNFKYVALLNNDAIADRKWLEELVNTIESDDRYGIVTSKIKHYSSDRLDSTGDYYTSWFLPYPRGRNVRDRGQYDTPEEVVSASGGASIYRAEMFKNIGLFDEDFFAYYEDVDISLRAHHAGWKVYYQPNAVVQHKIGATSSRIKGFTTLQTMKNLPLLMIKNVPFSILLHNILKFKLAYAMFFGRAVMRWQGYYALKGWLIMIVLLPSKLHTRRRILSRSQLTTKQFNELLVHDLPPNARALRKIRKFFKKK